MSVAITRDPGPLARLEEVVGQSETPSVVFQRVAEGESLKAIAASWQVPAGRFTEWFSTTHAELYDAALKVRADQLAHDALDAAFEATPESVQVQKLKADVALRLAAKWDRERYGDMKQVQVSVVPHADAELLTACGDLLRLAQKSELRLEREVHGEVLTVTQNGLGRAEI